MFLFALPLVPNAQILQGWVRNAQGEALPMATVQVQGQPKGSVTTGDGSFRYVFPAPGTYMIHIRYMGYAPLSQNLFIQGDTSVEFVLVSSASALDEVVVTGTRTPKMLKDAAVPTTVITSGDIQRSGAIDMSEVLQGELPGIEFSRQMDGQMVMNMQGMGGNDVLFLVDGKRLAGETLNNIDYERINPDQVERVEVVRGAGSALYGSNAVGGIVNIITKEAQQPWSLRLNARYGSHNEQKYGATLGFDRKKINSLTQFTYKSTDTYLLRNRDSAGTVFRIYGGRNINASQSFRYRLQPHLDLKADGSFYYRERDYSDTRKNRYTGGSASILFESSIGEKARLQGSYAFDYYAKANFYPRAGVSSQEYRNVQNALNLQFDYDFTVDNTLTAGLEYFADNLMSNQFDTMAGGRYRDYSAHTAVAYLQHDVSFRKTWFLVYGLRMDYNTRFKWPHLSPKVSLMYRFRPFSLRLSYAGGFRAPSLKEMFSNYDMGGLGWFVIYGNPELKSEKSNNVTLSVEYAGKSFSIAAVGYYRYTTDKITTVYNTRQDTAFYRNVNHSHTAGADVNLMVRLPFGFGIKAGYAYVFDRQRENGVNVSYARPHSAIFRVDYHYERPRYELGASLSGRVFSPLNSVLGTDMMGTDGKIIYEKVHYPAYTMWKLTLSQKFIDSFRLDVGIDNLFDYKPKHYDLVSVTSSGISFFISLSVDIDGLARFFRR